MAHKPVQTELEWKKESGCSDELTGRVGMFSLLRLIADSMGIGLGYVTLFEGNTILSCLREADPQMRWWHLEKTTYPDLVKVWRRKEWIESIEKQKVDAEKKAVLLITQTEYNHAKEVVMEFILLVCDGDKRAAERMFYAQGLANDQVKLINKAKSLSQAKEKREAESCSEERVAQLSEFEKLSQKMKGWKK